MIGRTFTRLTVVCEAPKAHRKRRWHCSCSCGRSTTSYEWSLLAGRSRSCGCLKGQELNKSQAHRRHGMRRSPEWDAWRLMKTKCFNVNYRGYSKYGGAGITVCAEWRTSFNSFYRDLGPRPSPYHTLERFDEQKDFNPANCRWVKTRLPKPTNASPEIELSVVDFDFFEPETEEFLDFVGSRAFSVE